MQDFLQLNRSPMGQISPTTQALYFNNNQLSGTIPAGLQLPDGLQVSEFFSEFPLALL